MRSPHDGGFNVKRSERWPLRSSGGESQHGDGEGEAAKGEDGTCDGGNEIAAIAGAPLFRPGGQLDETVSVGTLGQLPIITKRIRQAKTIEPGMRMRLVCQGMRQRKKWPVVEGAGMVRGRKGRPSDAAQGTRKRVDRGKSLRLESCKGFESTQVNGEMIG
jgi:hypothetical protein